MTKIGEIYNFNCNMCDNESQGNPLPIGWIEYQTHHMCDECVGKFKKAFGLARNHIESIIPKKLNEAQKKEMKMLLTKLTEDWLNWILDIDGPKYMGD